MIVSCKFVVKFNAKLEKKADLHKNKGTRNNIQTPLFAEKKTMRHPVLGWVAHRGVSST